MARIRIDGREVDVGDGDNLLAAALPLGFEIPYFCWHPALGSVGACRQCAVKQFKDADDRRGRLVMACMTPVKDGDLFSVDDPEAAEFRRSVIEWLMINHPHDCPVCDEGGECHLQDMTVLTGHAQRRYRFEKRTHRNQKLGPFVAHEMNRCIACYRCVRFYQDYAGGHDLQAFASKNHVYFGRAGDGVLESPFAGNLVEVCPTGVFTDKTLSRHYTRKWDLQSAPSVCAHCAVGCNTMIGERYGSVRRVLNRYHPQINGHFLCDRGRFGYEYLNGERRLHRAQLRDRSSPTWTPVDVPHVATLIQQARGIVGIGSPRASLETNFALRALVGAERFCTGQSDREWAFAQLAMDCQANPPARRASLADAEQADAVFIVGEDVQNTAPRLALALYQSRRRASFARADELDTPAWQDASVRDGGQGRVNPLWIVSAMPTAMDPAATLVLRARPDQLTAFVLACTRRIADDVEDVSLPHDLNAHIPALVRALLAAERPLVVSGSGQGSVAAAAAAAGLVRALAMRGKDAGLVLTLPECNTLGVAALGGMTVDDALDEVTGGRADTLLIVANDLYRRAPRERVDAALSRATSVIVIDEIAHDTARSAHVVLPGAAIAEDDGTLVNFEGRAQRFFQAAFPPGDARSAWRWLADLGTLLGKDMAWSGLDEVIAALIAELPMFAPVRDAAPEAGFRIAGQRVARQPHRYSGRTAMHADRTLFEPPPSVDADAPLSFSMEGHQGVPPAPLTPRYWMPGWNSAQALVFYQREIDGPVYGTPRDTRLIFQPMAGAWIAPSDLKTPWQAVPVHHVFGSETLSSLAPGVAALSPAPYVLMHEDDANAIQLHEGDEVDVVLPGTVLRLPIRFGACARGVVGLPVGRGTVIGLDLPATVEIRP